MTTKSVINKEEFNSVLAIDLRSFRP